MTPETAIERVLTRARSYVEHETPSGHAAPIIALSEQIERELVAAGARAERRDVPGRGRNLLLHVPGREPKLRPLAVLAHIDTVHPLGSLAQRPFRIEDGRAYAPGIYDMKTGAALVVEALTLLHERGTAPRRPVSILVSCDEEVGSHSSRPFIEQLARTAEAVLVPEPCLPDGGVKTQRKGVATYRLHTTGRAGHAGLDPGTTVSAIAELVDQSTRVLSFARPELGTTINIGTIAGGTASNVVAAEAWASVDVRIGVPSEGERVYAAMGELTPVRAGATVQAVRSENRPPLVRTDAVVALYQRAHAIAAELGLDLTEGAAGGGSDGSIANACGAATLDGLGPRGAGAHADDEHIIIADLPFRLAFMTRLLEQL